MNAKNMTKEVGTVVIPIPTPFAHSTSWVFLRPRAVKHTYHKRGRIMTRSRSIHKGQDVPKKEGKEDPGNSHDLLSHQDLSFLSLLGLMHIAGEGRHTAV